MWPFLSSSWVAFGRPSYLWAVLPGVPRHWRLPPASGGHPPRLIPPSGSWVYCLAPQKGEYRRGRRYFWPCRTRVGFGPATGPTLKTALSHIRALVGRNDKYRGPRGRSRAFVCGHPLRLIPPSGGGYCLEVFLALPDACGLRPCDRAHLKNGLVPYSCVGWMLQ